MRVRLWMAAGQLTPAAAARSTSAAAHCRLAVRLAPAATSYAVTVKTAADKDAGTDSWVHLSLVGPRQGSAASPSFASRPLLLDNPMSDEFQAGATDAFTLQAPPLARIDKVRPAAGGRPGLASTCCRSAAGACSASWLPGCIFFCCCAAGSDVPAGGAPIPVGSQIGLTLGALHPGAWCCRCSSTPLAAQHQLRAPTQPILRLSPAIGSWNGIQARFQLAPDEAAKAGGWIHEGGDYVFLPPPQAPATA